MISSIELSNFKCFEKQVIKTSPLTVLSGLNGMGKSTVIQSLLLLRQSYLQNTLQLLGLALNGEFVYIGTGKDALYQGANKEEIEILITTSEGITGKWCFNYDKNADVLPLKSKEVADDIYDIGLFSDKFHYLSAERVGPRSSFETSTYKVQHHRQIGIRGEFAVHYLSVFGDRPIPNERLIHPKAPSNQLKAQVNAWINELSPGMSLEVGQHKDIDLVSLHYQLTGAGDKSDYFRANNVGFGLTYTLPIILAVLCSPPGTILLFENPEAHLHPKGQAQMGRLLALAANSGIQVITETHSDHLLNGVRLAVHDGLIESSNTKLHFFQRIFFESELIHRIVSPEIDEDGRINYWPEGFFDQWDISLDALLSPRIKDE